MFYNSNELSNPTNSTNIVNAFENYFNQQFSLHNNLGSHLVIQNISYEI